MKTHKNLFAKICSIENLYKAYLKAKKGKTKKFYVIQFEKNLDKELALLNKELLSKTYYPKTLKKFIVRDPKTRTIHASAFRDRIVHHALVNILEPIYERIFICDSFASRKNKGTHLAVKRFEKFMKKVSRNGKLIKNSFNSNSIQGYVLKADIKHYFNNINHNVLISIINKKINDAEVLWLTRQILNNFDSSVLSTGMPLGNLTSQFFANVYLNELDYFVKHSLKVRFYIRYVDDFVILHRSRRRLEYFKEEIDLFIKNKLKLNLHQDKSKILVLRNGIIFLGYKVFYYNKRLAKRNIRMINKKIDSFVNEGVSEKKRIECFIGWEGYAKEANTHKLRKEIKNRMINSFDKSLNC